MFDYLSRFTEWRPYQHRVLASVDGQLVPIPINLDTINRLYGLKLERFELEKFFESKAETIATPRTSEDVVVGKVGTRAIRKVLSQLHPQTVGTRSVRAGCQVTARVPVRTNRDDRYFTDTYQAMPLHGYTRMFQKMLVHPNIKIMLNTDYREITDMNAATGK